MFSNVVLMGKVVSVSENKDGTVSAELTYTSWSRKDQPVMVGVVFPVRKAPFVLKSVTKGRTITVVGQLVNGTERGVYVAADDFHFVDPPPRAKTNDDTESTEKVAKVSKGTKNGGESYDNGKVDDTLSDDDFDAAKYATGKPAPKKQYAGDAPF